MRRSALRLQAATRAPGQAAQQSAVCLAGLIGNCIGAALDDEDKIAAQMDALEKGNLQGSERPPTSDFWPIWDRRPGPAYQQAGRIAASTHTDHIDGEPRNRRGTACRNPG